MDDVTLYNCFHGAALHTINKLIPVQNWWHTPSFTAQIDVLGLFSLNIQKAKSFKRIVWHICIVSLTKRLDVRGNSLAWLSVGKEKEPACKHH